MDCDLDKEVKTLLKWFSCHPLWKRAFWKPGTQNCRLWTLIRLNSGAPDPKDNINYLKSEQQQSSHQSSKNIWKKVSIATKNPVNLASIIVRPFIAKRRPLTSRPEANKVEINYANIVFEPKPRKSLAGLSETDCCLERTHYVHSAANESCSTPSTLNRL